MLGNAGSACCPHARAEPWPALAHHLQTHAGRSLIMFAGIYYGACCGSNTVDVFFLFFFLEINHPRRKRSMVTALEGNKEARPARGGRRSPPPRSSARCRRQRSRRSL